MNAIVYSATPKIIGLSADNSPSYSIIENPIGGTVVTSPITIKDMMIDQTVTTNGFNNCQLVVSNPRFGATAEFASLTPSICTVDSSGNVARIINGNGVIAITTPQAILGFTRAFNPTVITKNAFTGWQSHSAAKHITDSINEMVSGKTAGAARQAIFSTYTGTPPSQTFTRNANLFTSLDLSAISCWTSAWASDLFPVVLVTPYHLIAGHVGATPGQTVVFKEPGGGYQTRTVIDQQLMTSSTGTDFVAILDSPVNTITPMSLLPTNYKTYLPSINLSPGIMPVLNKGFTAGDWIRCLQNAGLSGPPTWILLQPNTDVTLASWSSGIIGGDSNGPVFLPINGVPVLVHCMNTGIGGYLYSNSLASIQAQLDSLSTANGKPQQNMTSVDLSGFNAY